MKKIFLLLCILSSGVLITAQNTEPPFKKEIDAFKKKDSVLMPATNSILFIGSSSFTKWTDVQDYFAGYPIINRGFGGSSLPDVIRYVDDIVVPYDPRQIVIYCGENDIAASDTITGEIVLQRFKQLFSLIRAKLPYAHISFISIKPSPSRWKFESVIVHTNALISRFMAQQGNNSFINIHSAMLNSDGSVMTDIFVADNLHMNAKGYKIWQPIIQRALLRL